MYSCKKEFKEEGKKEKSGASHRRLLMAAIEFVCHYLKNRSKWHCSFYMKW